MKNKCLVHKLAKLAAVTTISPETKELRSANLVTDVLVGGMAARRTSRTMRSTFEPFEFGHDARESGRSRMSQRRDFAAGYSETQWLRSRNSASG